MVVEEEEELVVTLQKLEEPAALVVALQLSLDLMERIMHLDKEMAVEQELPLSVLEEQGGQIQMVRQEQPIKVAVAVMLQVLAEALVAVMQVEPTAAVLVVSKMLEEIRVVVAAVVVDLAVVVVKLDLQKVRVVAVVVLVSRLVVLLPRPQVRDAMQATIPMQIIN